MPAHHDVRVEDVDLKRLGGVLWLAHKKRPKDFEELLLLEGLGPRTLQSLTMVSEVIYGTPSRFRDRQVSRLPTVVKTATPFQYR